MNAARTALPVFARTQAGAVLVTSLLMLLVLTIIGVTAMQMSRMQERMAGNTRDRNLAFQGAEAAVRAGEARLGTLTVAPVTCSTSPCQYWQDGSAGKNGRVDLADADWWATNGIAGDAKSNDKPQELVETPTFIIEEIGYLPKGSDVELGKPPEGHIIYQISGRSTGGSGLAETVVQTTFVPRF